MILKVAWRNIWRNKLRSAVIIVSVSLGLVAGIFSSAFVQGMMRQKVENVILKEMSHFQFHHESYRDEEKALNYYMEDGESILENLTQDEEVEAVTGRIRVVETMLDLPGDDAGLMLNGIDPEAEALVTRLDEDIVDGSYFGVDKKNPILISKSTADKYELEIGDKLLFNFMDLLNMQQSMKCKIVGIYETDNKMLDKMNAYVLKEDLQPLTGLAEGSLHEIAVFIKDYDAAETLALSYQEKYPHYEVIPWMDLSTGMRMMIDMMGMYSLILVGIILFALSFGVVNTMLMSVLERTREIGMLMAVGMKRQKVFVMIILETLFLTLIGGPLGILISWLLIWHYGDAGIPLGGAAYGDLGFSSVVHPYLQFSEYINIGIMVFFMALFASIFPSIKALRLKPVEAIRKI